MNTKQRTTMKSRAAKTNNGETADMPQPESSTREERAIYALERIAGSFERIATAQEEAMAIAQEMNRKLDSYAPKRTFF